MFDLAISDCLEPYKRGSIDDSIKEIARVSKRQMFNIEYESRWLIKGIYEPHEIVKDRNWWS